MKMMPPDVISHESQLEHLSEPSIFMLDGFRTADHAGQIFIPHRAKTPARNRSRQNGSAKTSCFGSIHGSSRLTFTYYQIGLIKFGLTSCGSTLNDCM